MRTVPRTPKAGSIFVARTLGLGVGVDDAEAVALDEVVGVGTAIVRVTLRTVGKTLIRARVWEPELVTEVVVKDVVSRMTVMLGVMVDVGAVEELDWAETESMKEA
jgi:hypothetical protein